MKPITLSLLLLVLAVAFIQPQAPEPVLQGPLLIARPPEGVTLIPAGETAVDQLVIRKRPGGPFPAEQVRGWGPRSVIAATAATQDQAIPAIVVTEGWDDAKQREWQGGTALPGGGRDPSYAAACLAPALRDVQVRGFDDTRGTWSVGGSVSGDPRRDAGKPDLYDGVLMKGQGVVVEGVDFFGIPGTALTIVRPGNPRFGQPQPFDTRTKHSVHRIGIKRAYRGFKVNAVDAVIGDIDVAAVRDWGVWLAVGATQIDGAIHTYGGRIGVWVEKGRNWGGPIYAEQSRVNLFIESNNNAFDHVYLHTAGESSLVITGNQNRIVSFEARSGAEGVVRLGGQFNTLAHGKVATRGQVGVRLLGGRTQRIEGVNFYCQGDGDTAMRAEAVLNDCTIDIHVWGNAADVTALDLSAGLGTGNRIRVTTSGTVARPLLLPATWDDERNEVTVDGVRQGAQADQS